MVARQLDKRIVRDDELSDSEDEDDRRNIDVEDTRERERPVARRRTIAERIHNDQPSSSKEYTNATSQENNQVTPMEGEGEERDFPSQQGQ